MQTKCDTCMNARPIISENGWHYSCTLPPLDAVYCMTGKEDDYIERPTSDDDYPKYYPPVGSCDYDEHELDMYYLGDSVGETYGEPED